MQFSYWNCVSGKDDKTLENRSWGFVLVRCTYADDTRWSSFLSALKEQNPLNGKLFQPWTTIEDKHKLANASLSVASLAFQEWVDATSTDVSRELNTSQPRHQYFIYVNEESIESVINTVPSRVWERTGNFLVLVDANSHIESLRETKDFYLRNNSTAGRDVRDLMAETEDITWKLIPATDLKSTYILFLRDPDPWYQGFNEFQSAPYVYHQFDVEITLDSLIVGPDPGYDVCKMLKKMYGKNHPRRVCFETEEAQSGLQRICGYAGGWRREEYTHPCYL